MKIMMKINARSALLAGKTQAGNVFVPVPATLNDAQRQELAHWRNLPYQVRSGTAEFYLMSNFEPTEEILERLVETSAEAIAAVLDELAEIRGQDVRAEQAKEAKYAAKKDREILALASGPVEDLLVRKYIHDLGNHVEAGLPYDLRSREAGFRERNPDQWAAAQALADERNATIEAERAKVAAAGKIAAAEREKEAEADILMRDQWIADHGSQRLKMILAENMIDNSLAVYRDERLASQRPAWIWDASWHKGEVDLLDVRNPSEKDLRWYRATRNQHPKCSLIYALLSAAQPDDYDDDDTPCVSEVVIKDRFLGKTVILRRDR